jgi:hypothetical protein
MQQSRKQSKEDKKWILCVLSLSLVSEGYGKNEYIIYHIHGFLEDMYYGKSPAEKSPAEKSPAEKSYAEKSPAEKSYAEKSPAASDGRGFFSGVPGMAQFLPVKVRSWITYRSCS